MFAFAGIIIWITHSYWGFIALFLFLWLYAGIYGGPSKSKDDYKYVYMPKKGRR